MSLLHFFLIVAELCVVLLLRCQSTGFVTLLKPHTFSIWLNEVPLWLKFFIGFVSLFRYSGDFLLNKGFTAYLLSLVRSAEAAPGATAMMWQAGLEVQPLLLQRPVIWQVKPFLAQVLLMIYQDKIHLGCLSQPTSFKLIMLNSKNSAFSSRWVL